MLGRDFTPADNTPGAEKVAIIGYGIWQRDFGGVADIVGKGVRINGKPATIVGVMPKGFAFPHERGALAAALQRVPAEGRATIRANISPSVIGLLKPGVSLDQANAEFTTLARRFADGLSRHEQAVQHRPGRAADQDVHAAPAARHAADDARRSASACC